MNTIPMTSKKTPQGEFHMDIYSRLLDSRVIMLDGEVNDQSTSTCTSTAPAARYPQAWESSTR